MKAIADVLGAGMRGRSFSADEWQQRIKPFTRPFLDEVKATFKGLGGVTSKSSGAFSPKGGSTERQALDFLRFPIQGYPKAQPRTDFKVSVSVGIFTTADLGLAEKLWWGIYAYGSDKDPLATTYLPDVRQFVASRPIRTRFAATVRATTGGWGPLLVEPVAPPLGPSELDAANRGTLVASIARDLFDLQAALS